MISVCISHYYNLTSYESFPSRLSNENLAPKQHQKSNISCILILCTTVETRKHSSTMRNAPLPTLFILVATTRYQYWGYTYTPKIPTHWILTPKIPTLHRYLSTDTYTCDTYSPQGSVVSWYLSHWISTPRYLPSQDTTPSIPIRLPRYLPPRYLPLKRILDHRRNLGLEKPTPRRDPVPEIPTLPPWRYLVAICCDILLE